MVTPFVELISQLEKRTAHIGSPLPDFHVLKSKQCIFHKSSLERGAWS
jgi:hypothetical protein